MSPQPALLRYGTHDNGGYVHHPYPAAKPVGFGSQRPQRRPHRPGGMAQEREAPMHRRILVVCGVALAVLAVLSASASATEPWQHCPTPDMPGLLKVRVAGCPEGRAVVEQFAWKAQYRGPKIRVFGFRCYAVNGSSPIRCRRGKKHIEYIGGF